MAAHGEHNSHSKLREEDVRAIRRMREDGLSVRAIHSRFPNVTMWCIYKVLNYDSWALVK